MTVTRIKKNTRAKIDFFEHQEEQEFILEEGASLFLYQIQTGKRNEQFHFKTQITQKQHSCLKLFSFFLGNQDVSNDLQVSLVGQGANAKLFSLYVLQENQNAKQNISIHHAVPNTQSSQLCKSILQNHAKARFTGKIRVEKNAQKTEASQLNKSLMLGPKAKVETQPFLEILADDVKCSHGATVSQLDEEQIFYLLSRGIPKFKAVQILIHGFSEDVLQNFEEQNLKNFLNQFLTKTLFAEAA